MGAMRTSLTQDEQLQAMTAHLSGLSVAVIAGSLNKTPLTVRRFLELKLGDDRSTLPDEADFVVHDSVYDWRAQDDAFQTALRRAIKRGLERVTEWTFVDDTPFSSRAVFFPVPRMSGCSSSAALCMEVGDHGGKGGW